MPSKNSIRHRIVSIISYGSANYVRFNCELTQNYCIEYDYITIVIYLLKLWIFWLFQYNLISEFTYNITNKNVVCLHQCLVCRSNAMSPIRNGKLKFKQIKSVFTYHHILRIRPWWDCAKQIYRHDKNTHKHMWQMKFKKTWNQRMKEDSIDTVRWYLFEPEKWHDIESWSNVSLSSSPTLSLSLWIRKENRFLKTSEL